MKIEFLTSLNGKEYMNITREHCSGLKRNDKVEIINIPVEYNGMEARYIKINAKNTILPEWHSGAGQPAWLFVDEVVVVGK